MYYDCEAENEAVIFSPRRQARHTNILYYGPDQRESRSCSDPKRCAITVSSAFMGIGVQAKLEPDPNQLTAAYVRVLHTFSPPTRLSVRPPQLGGCVVALLKIARGRGARTSVSVIYSTRV